MKKTDKFLVWFVIGVIVLVAAAFAMALLRPKATWQSEDTPGGVAFNYLLALQQEEYERAYGYLSPSIKGHPNDVSAFRRDVERYSWSFNNLENSSITLDILSTDLTGETAVVEVRETQFYERGLFDSWESTGTFDMILQQDADGNWRIVESDSYWISCWNRTGGCK